MTKNQKKTSNNNNIRTLADLHRSLPNKKYVTMNPPGGIAAAMKQPNFVKSRRKAPDGHEIIEVNYT